MEGNTYQNFRRKFIEDCLRNTMRRYTKEAISQELNEELERRFPGKTISPRTFESDWEFIKTELELANVELQKCKEGTQWLYRYSNVEFSIFNDFKKSEIEKL